MEEVKFVVPIYCPSASYLLAYCGRGEREKLQIDEGSPGAREQAQALDAKVEGGMYDALGLCVYQAKEDDDCATGEVKVLTNWGLIHGED